MYSFFAKVLVYAFKFQLRSVYLQKRLWILNELNGMNVRIVRAKPITHISASMASMPWVLRGSTTHEEDYAGAKHS